LIGCENKSENKKLVIGICSETETEFRKSLFLMHMSYKVIIILVSTLETTNLRHKPIFIITYSLAYLRGHLCCNKNFNPFGADTNDLKCFEIDTNIEDLTHLCVIFYT